MNDYGLESPRAQELIDAARAMGPALTQRRREQCKDRPPCPGTPRWLIFATAGFFKILQPEQWGGYAMDPAGFLYGGLRSGPGSVPPVPGYWA